MNPKKTIQKLKPLTVEKAWKMEVLAAAILLFLALWGDWIIYRNFVTERQAESVAEENGLVFLKKDGIAAAAQKLQDENSFLQNPVFPFVRDPF